MAGGETKDTIPDVLEIAARHPTVDAVVFLGMGIQANQGKLEREGPFFPDHGLERIVAYHERQDRRFTEAAASISDGHRQADPHRHRAGDRRPVQRRGAGLPGRRARSATRSANRAVTALAHLSRYARWRQATRPLT